MELPEILEYLMVTFTNPQCDSWNYTMYNFRESGVQISVFRTEYMDHEYGVLIMGTGFIIEGWADLIEGETWLCGPDGVIDGELAFRRWVTAVDESSEIPVIEVGH